MSCLYLYITTIVFLPMGYNDDLVMSFSSDLGKRSFLRLKIRSQKMYYRMIDYNESIHQVKIKKRLTMDIGDQKEDLTWLIK